MKKNKEICHRARVGGTVVLCIITAIVLRQLKPENDYLRTALWLIRPLIYIGLYIFWFMSFQRRVLHRRSRWCLDGIAFLMIFWLLVRTCKYTMPEKWMDAARLGWYLYYIPIILIPTLGLFLSFYVRQPENYEIPRNIHVGVFAISMLMIVMVLTNDFHQLVFQFPQGKPWSDHNYGYGIGYYVTAIWVAGCLIWSLKKIFRKCRISKSRKFIVLPYLITGIALLYTVVSCVRPPLWKLLCGDVTSAYCLLYAALLESCILCGLLPTNMDHEQLFESAAIRAQITDLSLKMCYVSDGWKEHPQTVSREILQKAQEKAVLLKDGFRLSSAPVRGGYVFWQEDLSELLQIMEELREAGEELKDANLVEEENLKVKKQLARLTVQNQIYDQVQSELKYPLEKLTGLVEQCEMAADMKKRREILQQMALVGAYLKRRSNLLILSMQHENISVGELSFSLEESFRSMRLCGAEGAFSTNYEGVLPGQDLMKCYDLFEQVLENAENLTTVYVYLNEEKEKRIFIINVDCKRMHQEKLYGNDAEIDQDLDGSWIVSLCLKKRG